MRDEFEKWYANEAFPSTRSRGYGIHGFRRTAHGEYWDSDIDAIWRFFEAGRKAGALAMQAKASTRAREEGHIRVSEQIAAFPVEE